MGKKSNAKRKQGLKEMAEGVKQMYLTSGKKAAKGMAKGAIDGFTSGTGLADKVVKGVTGMVTKGVGAGIGDMAKGNWKFIKGAAKAIFNDLNWYQNYPELIKGMAGANFSIDDSRETSYQNNSGRESKALIATHYVALTNGSSEKMRNMAIQKIFEATRRANSGSVNYTQADINAYYTIVRNIVALATQLRRVYGLTNYYTSANTAVPNLYIRALGFDANDIIANSANIRNYLKRLAKRLEVYVPLNLPIIDRTEWMFNNLFNDSDDIKAQKHAFVLNKWLTYVPANNSWKIETISALSTLTSAQYINTIETELVALTKACPAGVIAGDMIKAFGVNAAYHFGDTAEDYVTPQGYSEEVLTQIQNEVSIPGITVTDAVDSYGLEYVDITLASVPGSQNGSQVHEVFVRDMNEPSINFYKNDISNVDIIGASRLIMSAAATITRTSTSIKFNYGTEVIVSTICFYLASGTVAYDSMNTYNVASFANINSVLHITKSWSVIDWMPRISMELTYYNSTQSQLYTSINDIWDYNNSGFLSILSLEAMHDVAFASLYYVPLLTKEQNNLAEIKG